MGPGAVVPLHPLIAEYCAWCHFQYAVVGLGPISHWTQKKAKSIRAEETGRRTATIHSGPLATEVLEGCFPCYPQEWGLALANSGGATCRNICPHLFPFWKNHPSVLLDQFMFLSDTSVAPSKCRMDLWSETQDYGSADLRPFCVISQIWQILKLPGLCLGHFRFSCTLLILPG